MASTTLPEDNSASCSLQVSDLTQTTRALLARAYALDFQLFSYSTNVDDAKSQISTSDPSSAARVEGSTQISEGTKVSLSRSEVAMVARVQRKLKTSAEKAEDKF